METEQERVKELQLQSILGQNMAIESSYVIVL